MNSLDERVWKRSTFTMTRMHDVHLTGIYIEVAGTEASSGLHSKALVQARDLTPLGSKFQTDDHSPVFNSPERPVVWEKPLVLALFESACCAAYSSFCPKYCAFT